MGDLYKTYDFDAYINFRFYYGHGEKAWLNYSLILTLFQIASIIFEFMNVVRMVLRFKGSKLNKGSAARFRIFLTISPLFGFFLFFTEAMQVLGFNGDVCFCNFRDTYNEYWGGYIGYDCMVNLKNNY